MPVQCPPMPRQIVERREFDGSDSGPLAQGPEGLRVRENMMKVATQWLDRAEPVLRSEFDDRPQFRHVVFESVGKRRVRYSDAGPLPPRKFSFDD
jgi:hypothetical protein